MKNINPEYKCIFILAFMMIILGQGVNACTCGPKTLDNNSFRQADMIIIGEVVNVERGKIFSQGDSDEIKIKVDKVWKRKIDQYISLAVLDIKDMCGDLKIQIGKKYFFFIIKKYDRFLVVGDCDTSRPIENATDSLKYLSSKTAYSYTSHN